MTDKTSSLNLPLLNDSDTSRIRSLKISVQLTGQEVYDVWAEIMQVMMDANGLWDPKTDLPIISGASKHAIYSNVDLKTLATIRGCSDAAAMWTRLAKDFSGVSITTQVSLLSQLVSLKWSEGGVIEHFNLMDQISRNLKAAIGPIKPVKENTHYITVDDLIVFMTLQACPVEFKAIITYMERESQKAGTLTTLEDLRTVLLNEETGTKRFQVNNNLLAFKAFTGTSSTKSDKSPNVTRYGDSPLCVHKKAAITCWDCKPHLKPSCEPCKSLGLRKLTHNAYSKYCPLPKPSIDNNHIAMMAFQTSDNKLLNNSLLWISDSAANHHIAFDKSIFTNYEPYNNSVFGISGIPVASAGIGSVSFISNGLKFILNDVIHCPNVNYNLLSVGKCLDHKLITSYNTIDGQDLVQVKTQNNI